MTRRFSLRTRLTWFLALMILVVLGSAARIVDLRADSDMQQRFDASLLSRAQSLADLVTVEHGTLAMNPHVASPGAFPGAARNELYTIRCDGVRVAGTPHAPPATRAGESPSFANAKLADGTRLRVVTLRFRPSAASGPAAATAGPTCSLRYALDRQPLREILQALDYILLGTLMGACALVLVLTPWLVQRALRPLSVLDRAMAGIGPDTPGQRLPETSVLELAPMVDRFNQVLARMDAGLTRERRFASGLAHEFRTHLAELRTLVDVEKRYPSGRELHSLLDEVGAIGGELEATVTALLQLTRIESGLEQSRREDVAIAPFVARACARQREPAAARNVTLAIDTAVPADAVLTTDPALLEIVLDNLLGNAVAYAPGGTPVHVRTTGDGFAVGNAAPALRAGDLDHFGHRFWRKDAQGAGHAGLGLALAGAAAHALQMPLAFTLEQGRLRVTLGWRVRSPRA